MEKFDFRDAIKQRLQESYVEPIMEDDDEGRDENGNEEKITGQYKRLQGILSNDIFNHAAIERRAFGKSDGTTRSLFKKKLDRFKDEQGGTYAFDDGEIAKILGVIQNISAGVLKTINQKDKE